METGRGMGVVQNMLVAFERYAIASTDRVSGAHLSTCTFAIKRCILCILRSTWSQYMAVVPSRFWTISGAAYRSKRGRVAVRSTAIPLGSSNLNAIPTVGSLLRSVTEIFTFREPAKILRRTWGRILAFIVR